MTKFNMMYVLLHFEIFKEGGNDIRYKSLGSPSLLARKPYFEVHH